jgi:hypothetical protein
LDGAKGASLSGDEDYGYLELVIDGRSGRRAVFQWRVRPDKPTEVVCYVLT